MSTKQLLTINKYLFNSEITVELMVLVSNKSLYLVNI